MLLDSSVATTSVEGDNETSNKDDNNLMPNSGNGCDLANYSWTQTLDEVELKVPIKLGFKLKSKDVIVNFKKKHLQVGAKGMLKAKHSTQDKLIICYLWIRTSIGN